MTLTCPVTKVIRIGSAVFGHFDHEYCGDGLITDNCNQEGDFDVVDGLCSEERTCDVYVSPKTFGGDQCIGTEKYLHVHYTCVCEYRIKPEELYILGCGKGRGRRQRPFP